MKLPKTKRLQGELFWALLLSFIQSSTGGRIEILQGAANASGVRGITRTVDEGLALGLLQKIADITKTPVGV